MRHVNIGLLAVLLVGSAALADKPHLVKPGDTLMSVASKYQIPPERLREVNAVNAVADDDLLPRVVLNIPAAISKAAGNTTPKPDSSLPKKLEHWAVVGRVTTKSASICQKPDAKAPLHFRCPKGTELAILGQENQWAKVLMQDRSIGWIPAKYLKFTDALVVVDVPIKMPPAPLPDVVITTDKW